MVLSVRELTVRTGNKALVSSLSFDVERGELLGVFGSSGAGKSTTLMTIQGLQAPDFHVAGSIRFRGVEVIGLPAEQRSLAGISIVLQGLALFPDRTVLQNVVYPLRHRGKSSREAQRMALEQLAALHIEDLATRYPHEISGGQQQRVALARAMVFEPSLLLLDEPFKGLEQELRDQLLGLVRSLAIRGTSILFVTHDRRELDLAADKAIHLDEGVIRATEVRTNHHDSPPFELTERRLRIGSDSGVGSVGLSEVSLAPANSSSLRDGLAGGEVLEFRFLRMGQVAVILRYRSGDIGVVECASAQVQDLQIGQEVVLTRTERNRQ